MSKKSPLDLLIDAAQSSLKKGKPAPSGSGLSAAQTRSIDSLVGKPKARLSQAQKNSIDALVKGKPQNRPKPKPKARPIAPRASGSSNGLGSVKGTPLTCSNFVADFVLSGGGHKIRIPASSPLEEEEPEYGILYANYSPTNAMSMLIFSRGIDFASRYYGYLVTNKLVS